MAEDEKRIVPEAPLDIAAVRHDDALIDSIAADREFECADADERLIAALLTDWRSAIVDLPMPDAPDLDLVAAEVHSSITARRYRMASLNGLRILRPVMSAAAVLAIIVGGLSVFSYNATPASPLWGVKEVMFSEQAASTVARMDAADELSKADTAISSGNPTQAISHLETAASRAQAVNDTDAHDQIIGRISELMTTIKSTYPKAPIESLLPSLESEIKSSFSSFLPTSPVNQDTLNKDAVTPQSSPSPTSPTTVTTTTTAPTPTPTTKHDAEDPPASPTPTTTASS